MLELEIILVVFDKGDIGDIEVLFILFFICFGRFRELLLFVKFIRISEELLFIKVLGRCRICIWYFESKELRLYNN